MNHGHPPRNQATAHPLARLCDGGTLAGRTDGELLARFAADGDEAAFEGLVARLGPMVLGVCRRMLGAQADADDAFQATFLVLVRRARAVGRGDLIGPWLHGVAVRVCRKARARASRLRARERAGLAVADLPAVAAVPEFERAETRAAIDDAIAGLPEGYRRLVVLCDVEGLTRDEAAGRLGWTPNMVRGRLSRARRRLRASLIRRGCVPPGFPPGDDAAGPPAALRPSPPSPFLVASAARAALALASPPGRRVAAALAPATTLHLADGVIQTMRHPSWKLIGSTLILGGSIAAGAAQVLLAQAPGPAVPVPPPARPASPPRANAEHLEKLFRAAQYRYAFAKTRYDTRDGTAYGLLSASQGLMEAGLTLHADPEGRQLDLRGHLERTEELLANQARRLAAGFTTRDNVESVARARRDALALLERSRTPGAAIAVPTAPASLPEAAVRDIENRITLARESFEVRLAAYGKAEVPLDGVLAAGRRLMRAELAAAFTPYQRRAAVQAHVEHVERFVAAERERLLDGGGDPAGEAAAGRELADARALLAAQPDGLDAATP